MTRKNSVRLTALTAVLMFTFQIVTSVSGHEGHKHSNAPVTAKKLKNPLTADDGTLKAGKQLFDKHCAVCHGQDGKSQTDVAASMKKKPTDLTAKAMQGITDGEIWWVVTNGIRRTGMPAYKTKIDDAGRWQMTVYVKQLMGGHQHQH
jgi:mono/diheme cytochrome c family protein